MAAVVQPAQTMDRPTLRAGLDPYGQLLKMLMPRARALAVYGPDAQALWIDDGQDRPELHAMAAEALDETLGSPYDIDGFARPLDGGNAYAFRLRDEQGVPLAAVTLALPAGGDARPFSLVLALVRPALECLVRELAMRASLGAMSRDLSSRDRDLELLLDVAKDDTTDARDADELGRLVQAAVDHLGVAVGALIVPEKGIAAVRLSRTASSGAPNATDIVTRTHRHLMTWAQMQRRTMVVNKVTASEKVPPFKILSVPVRHLSNRVIGFLALFNPADATDFDLRHQRLTELLSRKVSSILQMSFDAVTGLATRSAFEAQVASALVASRGGMSHCVIYIDLDQMHVINENFGMHVGDEVIVKVAEVLRRRVPVGAYCARISGDRFAAFVANVDLDRAATIAEDVRGAASELTQTRGTMSLRVSLSAGVAEISLQSRHPLAHAMAAAEIACKAAKDRGRNRIELYQAADQSIIQRHSDVHIMATLRNALATDRFRLYTQPMLPLGGNAGEPRFEILLRMLSDSNEILPPSKFLSAAERYQLMPAIDRWVIENTFRALKPHHDLLKNRVAQFSVNLSGQSIGDESLLPVIEAGLRDSGMPADMICFELTETAAVGNLDRAEAFMQRLRAAGFHLALDDFGTGASSLAYLKTLPVSVLKIDGSFVRDALVNSRSDSMVKAIAQLARTMGMTTVAEYVETDELRIRMTNLGVDYGQGFAIGKPVPLAEVLADLSLYTELGVVAGEPLAPPAEA